MIRQSAFDEKVLSNVASCPCRHPVLMNATI
jgi:hypothetical protein